MRCSGRIATNKGTRGSGDEVVTVVGHQVSIEGFEGFGSARGDRCCPCQCRASIARWQMMGSGSLLGSPISVQFSFLACVLLSPMSKTVPGRSGALHCTAHLTLDALLFLPLPSELDFSMPTISCLYANESQIKCAAFMPLTLAYTWANVRFDTVQQRAGSGQRQRTQAVSRCNEASQVDFPARSRSRQGWWNKFNFPATSSNKDDPGFRECGTNRAITQDTNETQMK